MFIQEKAETTRTIWKFLIGGMVLMALFLGELGVLLIPIYAMMLVAASITTHSIWNGNFSQADTQEYREKAKRERLDTVIRNLSTQELQVLRERLTTGAINEDDLYDILGDEEGYYIDDDGELLLKNSG
ncbi:MAG: hypothetical protein ACPG7F_10880 [Aggregatilineales bacterium]